MLANLNVNKVRIAKIVFKAHLTGITSLKAKRSRMAPIWAGLQAKGYCAGVESGDWNVPSRLELTIVVLAENADTARSRVVSLIGWLEGKFRSEEWSDQHLEWLE